MDEKWYQIEIEDEAALSGASIVRLVQTVVDAVPATVVGIMGAEGAGPNFGTKFPKDGVVILDISTFATYVADVAQFDWGDFLLVREQGELSGVQPSTPHTDILPRTLATIRAVDDTYFYVYTRDEKAAQAVHKAYPAAVSRKREMSELDFPC